MAEVPSVYIKDKPVDYEGEILAMLGEGVRVGDFHFRPPSLGVWALWEVLDSPIIHGSDDATTGDYLRLLWVNHTRSHAVKTVAEWVREGKPPVGENCKLDEVVMSWSERHVSVDVINGEGMDLIIAQLPLCYTGYETLPKSEGTTGPWLFAGEAFGAICAQSPADHHCLIWDVPMTLHGHATAHRAACNGAKGIARPKDEEDIKEQLMLANKREKNGELHPWQIDEPIAFPLSAVQCEFPATVARYEELVKAKKNAIKN